MAIGIITGQKIGTNKDGDVNRILLQVEMMTDDVRTIELFTQAGEDTNPGNGCRVNIVPVSSSYQIAVGISDDLESECDPGEKEIYSTDSPVSEKKSRIKLTKDGDILIDAYGGATVEIKQNGDIVLNAGTGSAMKYTELNSALQSFISDFMLHVHKCAAPGAPSTVPTVPVTLDISGCEVPEVQL